MRPVMTADPTEPSDAGGLWSTAVRPAIARAAAALLAVAALVPVGVITGTPTPAAAAGDAQIDITAAGPLGPITVIGDSVLVGASFEPSLPTLLAEQGWGPIRFRAGLGYTTGRQQPATSTFSARRWLEVWRSQGWDAPNVVVNLGNNDVGFCGADLACNADNVRYLLDAIGPGHTVWWSRITRLFTQQADADAFNGALELVAAERGNLRLWDWPAARNANDIAMSWDGIHLRDLTAYRTRSRLMAADITAQLAIGARTGGDAAVPAALAGPAEYLPLAPTRVLDTRTTHTRLAAGATAVVDLSSVLPAGASAAAVNLTAVGPAADGFLTAHPCVASPPSVSSVNFTRGTDRGALAVLPVTASRTLCVLSSAAADLVVDVQGAFVGDGSRFTPAVPTRLVDTRDSGRRQQLELRAPAGAAAVALNLTVTGSAVPGFLSAFPCDAGLPSVSNVNFGTGETVAGAAFVPVSATGTVCVFTNTPDVDVVVDLTGTFSTTGRLAFVPASPSRVLDTRSGVGGWTPVQGAGQVLDVRVAPPEAEAVTGTLTIVTPAGDGFLTAYGCGAVPPTSNVNAPRSGVLANSVTVGTAASGRLCVRSLTATQTVFDTTGWWVP
jgi:hypothetical protein